MTLRKSRLTKKRGLTTEELHVRLIKAIVGSALDLGRLRIALTQKRDQSIERFSKVMLGTALSVRPIDQGAYAETNPDLFLDRLLTSLKDTIEVILQSGRSLPELQTEFLSGLSGKEKSFGRHFILGLGIDLSASAKRATPGSRRT